MYNLADTVFRERIAHDQKSVPESDITKFKAKTVYESYKIAANMKAAKRKLWLSSRIISRNIENDGY